MYPELAVLLSVAASFYCYVLGTRMVNRVIRAIETGSDRYIRISLISTETPVLVAYGDGSPSDPLPACLLDEKNDLCDKMRICTAQFLIDLPVEAFLTSGVRGEFPANLISIASRKCDSTSKSSNAAELVSLTINHSIASGHKLVLEEMLQRKILLLLFTDSYGMFRATYSLNPTLAPETMRYKQLLQSVR